MRAETCETMRQKPLRHFHRVFCPTKAKLTHRLFSTILTHRLLSTILCVVSVGVHGHAELEYQYHLALARGGMATA